MESAYLLLAAEGYIISKPQSGYYVTDIADKQRRQVKVRESQKKSKEDKILYGKYIQKSFSYRTAIEIVRNGGKE